MQMAVSAVAEGEEDAWFSASVLCNSSAAAFLLCNSMNYEAGAGEPPGGHR